jgi:hypothetical protein
MCTTSSSQNFFPTRCVPYSPNLKRLWTKERILSLCRNLPQCWIWFYNTWKKTMSDAWCSQDLYQSRSAWPWWISSIAHQDPQWVPLMFKLKTSV